LPLIRVSGDIALFAGKGNAKTLESLPGNTRRYIERIEEITGVKMALVSVGPDRDETISLYDPFYEH